MKDIRTNIGIKIITYILIPILVLVLVVGILGLIVVTDMNEKFLTENEYKESNLYYRGIQELKEPIYAYEYRNLPEVQKQKLEDYTISKLDLISSKTERTYNFQYGIKNIQIFIVDQVNKKAYTNMKLNLNYQSINDYIKEIETQENITVENLNPHDNVTVEKHIGYTVRLDETTTPMYLIYLNNYLKEHTIFPYVVLVISTIVLLVIGIYQFLAIGHEKGQEGFRLNAFDRIPLELLGMAYCIVSFIIMIIFIALITAGNTYNIDLVKTKIMITIIFYIIMYVITAISTITVIRRIKAKSFWKTTAVYYCLNYIGKTISSIGNSVFKDINLSIKIIAVFLAVGVISLFLQSLGPLGVLLMLALWAYIINYLLKKVNQLVEIHNVLAKIKEGNLENKLDINNYDKEFEDTIKNVNGIIENYYMEIEKGIKSERLKTELITNVSHDIKTPLTSIINYVDLLKKEDINNEKANEYLNILDNKSQRLKRLIEDLVEASKVSSGNIELHIEKICIEDLINQTIAEFSDKFEEKNLSVIIEKEKEEKTYIEADNRYMYRVIENMYSNIYKYALENSRIYIELKENNGKINITLKNISKEKLNISADELMQRFVRGDKSRKTEGSGLGISIAKSLIEMQNGIFSIAIDGDLFRVDIAFDILE